MTMGEGRNESSNPPIRQWFPLATRAHSGLLRSFQNPLLHTSEGERKEHDVQLSTFLESPLPWGHVQGGGFFC